MHKQWEMILLGAHPNRGRDRSSNYNFRRASDKISLILFASHPDLQTPELESRKSPGMVGSCLPEWLTWLEIRLLSLVSSGSDSEAIDSK